METHIPLGPSNQESRGDSSSHRLEGGKLVVKLTVVIQRVLEVFSPR